MVNNAGLAETTTTAERLGHHYGGALTMAQRKKIIAGITEPLRKKATDTRAHIQSKTGQVRFDWASELFFEAKGALCELEAKIDAGGDDSDGAQAECFSLMLEAEAMTADAPVWAKGFTITRKT